MYLKESTALQIVCTRRLETIRLEDYSNSASFFSDFEKLINELKGAGAQVSEKEKLNYMLNTLPEEYSYIADIIDALKEENQTVAYVKNKIEIAEKKRKPNRGGMQTNAFSAKREGCFRCGREGHFARECQNGVQGGSSNSYWRGSTRGRSRGKGNRSNTSRGRRQSTAGMSEHGNSGADAWIATALTAHSRETNKISENEIVWLLNSGCTDHIINNESYFEKCSDLKEPVNIYLCDDRPVKAMKVGNVISYFEAFGKQNEINMTKVFYAKGMSANLISLGKLAVNKNKVLTEGNITKVINKNNKLTAVAFKKNGIYRMKSILKVY
ncbi:uncharacterized protein LOC132915737 [Bombus pascuorum]|uniref:uncharacterized protein LOC132915737 n=1 Tax=Bombus pascuorum TaxID=65598 RepID=UPI00298EB7A1|nr:uncharacterized protein LOC132915737 [Bombus pascuorum]